MKILLTGATGFLGSYILRQLLDGGHTVKALCRPDSRMDLVASVADRVEWSDADVTDVVALEDTLQGAGIELIVHCAAVVSFHPNKVRRMMQVNVDGTTNLINLALDLGIPRFVHVSSIATLGHSKERPLLSEQSKWETSSRNSNYAISKYLSEQEVWRGEAEGLSVAVVNPAVILGSSYWEEGTARFFPLIYRGLKFWPTGATGFVDVRDVARFVRLMVEHNTAGKRYVLCSENRSYREFFSLISKELGVKGPQIKVAPWMANLAWRFEWLKEKIVGSPPTLTRESARSSATRAQYDNARSLAAFPGQFTYTPLEQTIRETAAQYLESVALGKRSSVLKNKHGV